MMNGNCDWADVTLTQNRCLSGMPCGTTKLIEAEMFSGNESPYEYGLFNKLGVLRNLYKTR